MNRIVSQDELDVILAADGAGGSSVARYDFRRPDRVTTEQLRALQFLHDRFAHNVSTSLSAFLRTTTEMTIVSVDQLSYGEFLAALPDPTVFYAIGMPPLEVLGALEINPRVAFSMVDRMLGGTGTHEAPDRPLTEIEQNVVDSVVKLLVDHLTESWRAVSPVQFAIAGRDTQPQMVHVAGPNEIMILVLFGFRVADAQGTLKLCVPVAAIEALGDTFAQARHRTARPPSPEEAARLAANLGRVPLAVSAQLTTTISARELIALRPGDVLSLGRSSGAPVAVSVGDVPAFSGGLVVRNGSLAITIQASAPEPGEGGL